MSQKNTFTICSAVVSFLLEFTSNKAVDDYINDRAFRSALERELQIIGEALIGLEKAAPAVAAQIPEYQNIIGFPSRSRAWI